MKLRIKKENKYRPIGWEGSLSNAISVALIESGVAVRIEKRSKSPSSVRRSTIRATDKTREV